MGERRARYDSYGRPLPILADVQEQSLLDTATNLEARRLLQQYLEEIYREVLRRGFNAIVDIRFIVADGTIQQRIWTGTRRKRGGVQGWRQPGEGR